VPYKDDKKIVLWERLLGLTYNSDLFGAPLPDGLPD
jgi:hypothetical protein